MTIFDVGRICVKIAGRDAGRKCVVVENVDSRFVVIDGDVRRRRVNVRHLEPMEISINLKGTSRDDVKAAFSEMGYAFWETKAKKPAARTVRLKKRNEKTAKKKGSGAEEKTDKTEETKKTPEKVNAQTPNIQSPHPESV